MSYRSHPAFAETVEFIVYLASDARGRGVGSMLCEALLEELRHEKVHCVIVGIAGVGALIGMVIGTAIGLGRSSASADTEGANRPR